jgi:GDP-L-fucose synthase
MQNKRKILVLGGNGFMGRNIQHYVKRDDSVFYFKSRRNGLDLQFKDDLFNFIQKNEIDVIINCAAVVGSVHYVSANKSSIIYQNTLIYLNIYEAVKIYTDVYKRKIKIINPISNCSYPGDTKQQIETEWWNGKPHESVFSYAMSKKTLIALSETYENEYVNSYNFIMPNAYGLFDYDDPTRVHALNGLIIRMIKSMKSCDKEFVIWGSGEPIREWILMEDAAKFINCLIDEDKRYPMFNLGQNKGYSILETANLIKNYLKYDVDFIFDRTKIDGDKIKIMDDTKLKELYPNFEFTKYVDGVEKTIDYYLTIL